MTFINFSTTAPPICKIKSGAEIKKKIKHESFDRNALFLSPNILVTSVDVFVDLSVGRIFKVFAEATMEQAITGVRVAVKGCKLKKHSHRSVARLRVMCNMEFVSCIFGAPKSVIFKSKAFK